jgi:hypothetical protein
LGQDGEGDVAVPADEAAAFEVVDPETGFEFAVVVFDAPQELEVFALAAAHQAAGRRPRRLVES